MSKRTLPAMKAFQKPEGMESPPPAHCFARWNAALTGPQAASGDTVIDVLDVIGIDPWTGEGVNTAYVLSKLRGAGDVTVNINSPGGDYFEGAAIYELLRGHAGAVTVNILGLAASAASIIAMAGDEIRMGQTGFYMIHNCWGVCIGDRHDMAACADLQGQIDAAICSVYADRSKLDADAIGTMMDAESWIGAQKAIEQGFADAVLPPGDVGSAAQARERQAVHARRHMDSVMAHSGITRAERRRMFNEIKHGKPGAAVFEGMQDAARLSALADDVRKLHQNF